MRDDNQSYFEDEEFKELLSRYEHMLLAGEFDYMDADDLTDIAEYYMMNNREEDANACIDFALSIHPDAVDPLIFRSRQAMFHDDMEQAYSIMHSIPDQSDREVHFLHAELLLKEGRKEEADALMQKILEQEEHRRQFMVDCTELFMDYSAWDVAARWTKQMRHDYPRHRKTNILYADLLINTGKNEDAIPVLEKMLDEDSFDTQAWGYLADAYAGMAQYQKALECLDYLLAINENDAQAQCVRGIALTNLNRSEEAHRQFQTYLQRYPDDPVALNNDASCLICMNRFDDALKLLLKSEKIAEPGCPDQVFAQLQACYVLSKLGRTDEAIGILDKTRMSIEPPNNEYYVLYGHIMLENKNMEKAEEMFGKAIQLSGNSESTMLGIAISYGETGYFEQSLMRLEHLYALTSNEEMRYKCLPYVAFCHYNLQHTDAFLKFLKMAVEKNPGTTEYMFNSIFPNTKVEDYYREAFKKVYGTLPG